MIGFYICYVLFWIVLGDFFLGGLPEGASASTKTLAVLIFEICGGFFVS